MPTPAPNSSSSSSRRRPVGRRPLTCLTRLDLWQLADVEIEHEVRVATSPAKATALVFLCGPSFCSLRAAKRTRRVDGQSLSARGDRSGSGSLCSRAHLCHNDAGEVEMRPSFVGAVVGLAAAGPIGALLGGVLPWGYRTLRSSRKAPSKTSLSHSASG